jgi:hypothetical protein
MIYNFIEEKQIQKNNMNQSIPEGLKCYEIVEIIDFDKGDAIIKHCPYWVQCDEGRCKCLFLGLECEEGDEDIGIWKKEKECNINLFDNYDKEVPEFYFD